ncbi:MAG: DUF1800 family protein [Planctomycetota bacterium]|nr:MAG: DUF1800 family protein [Planctomycetota bacterium]
MRNRATLLLVALAAGAIPSAVVLCEESSPEARAGVAFLTSQQVLWLDRSHVIPFRAAGVVQSDATLECRVDDPIILAVLRAPTILPGERTGFLRVRALALGATTLHVGSASLRILVRALPVVARIHRSVANITTPAQGAVVWGIFSVGVEVSPGARGGHDDAPVRVRLRVPGRELLEPVRLLPRLDGLVRRARFDVDASDLPEGLLELVAVLQPPDGAPVESRPLSLTVVHPDAGAVVAGECEAFLDAPRPEAFGAGIPAAGFSPDASGGGFVVNGRPEPVWILPFEVERGGRHQVTVVARGDFGAGAFPSIGLCVDAPRPVLTAVRLVDDAWHRIPVGFPVELEPGEHTLAIRFMNDLRVSGTSDRNLFLDRFEILALDGSERAVPAGPARDIGMALDAGLTMTVGDSGGMMAGSSGSSNGIWIAFERPLDGLPVNGRLQIEGYTRYRDMGAVAAPRVELLVNGAIVATQQAVKPLFVLDRAALAEGPNRIQLVATLADGRRARTPEQVVHVNGHASGVRSRAFHRFGVHDERWNEAVRAAFTDRGQESGHSVARPAEPVRFTIRLPVELAGDFDVLLDARGPSAKLAPASVRIVISSEGAETVERELNVANWWSLRDGGEVRLAAGPKELALDIDPGGNDGGNDAFALRAVILRERRAAPDRTPPRATILYPPPGHEAAGVDAVIVEAWDDDDRLESGDVLIDGRLQGTAAYMPDGAGYLVFPLILRSIAPGAHTLSVRVLDRAGNVGESARVPFVVRAESAPWSGPYARAVRLLDRFAFGPDPRELAELLLMGEREWLADGLARQGAGDEAALGAAVARRADFGQYSIRRAVLAHVLRTPNPARTRLAFWVENHFSTWMGKTQGPAEWYEHLAFLALGAAPFGELLAASATSPAMLFYLDQARSYSGRLNENYAREIMELHTVGVDGGYSQADVTALAWLLTGLTLAEEASPNGEGGYLTRRLRFDPELSDGRARTVLGMRFDETPPDERFDRFRLTLELLAGHPSTARFVCRKLAEHYVSTPAPDDLVDDLARVFRASGGDLAEVLLAIADHPAFWEDAAPRVTTPFDYGVRLARATGVFAVDGALVGFLDRSGMGLFDCATPDGYPEGDAEWTDSNAVMQRWRLPQEIPWAVRRIVPDALRRYGGGDPTRWHQRVVDVAAVRLTGRVLGEESNAAVLEFFDSQTGNAWEQVDRAAVLISRMPEASLK